MSQGTPLHKPDSSTSSRGFLRLSSANAPLSGLPFVPRCRLDTPFGDSYARAQ